MSVAVVGSVPAIKKPRMKKIRREVMLLLSSLQVLRALLFLVFEAKQHFHSFQNIGIGHFTQYQNKGPIRAFDGEKKYAS